MVRSYEFEDIETTEISENLAQLKRNRRVIPRIPKGARIQAAEALATLINTALDDKSVSTWSQLLSFPALALSVPPRDISASDVSFTTKIKRQISDYIVGGVKTTMRSLLREAGGEYQVHGAAAPENSSNKRARHYESASVPSCLMGT